MSLPLFWNDDGLPIGAMLGARFGGEATLLQVARQCEQLSRWEFLLTLAPLKIPGGTGSPANPIAMF